MDYLKKLLTSRKETPTVGIYIGTKDMGVGAWHDGRMYAGVNIPAYVAFTENESFVGDAALDQIKRNAANTVFDIRKLIGRQFSDPCIQKGIRQWPFTVVAGYDGKPHVVVKYKQIVKQFSAVDLLSMLLKETMERAERFILDVVKNDVTTIENVVITVPAYFDNTQRCAVKEACTKAGIDVLQIIVEPIAASMAMFKYYPSMCDENYSNFLIFHLGGSTFDVSVVNIQNKIIKVKAVVEDSHFGGDHFTLSLVDHCTKEYWRRYNKDITRCALSMRMLECACEKAKIELTTSMTTMVKLGGDCCGSGFSCPIDRPLFNGINNDHFTKCINLVEKCLLDAKTEKKDIHPILLIGLSTKMHRIEELLQEFFKRKRLGGGLRCERFMAIGAAVIAAQLRGKVNMEISYNIPINTEKETGPNNEHEETDHGFTNFAEFSYAELKEATNNFNDDHKIGEGAYGTVYRGVIHCTTVAIKVLNKGSEAQGEREFNQEVLILRNVTHRNLVNLIGACPEKWALVYEFLSKGNLENCLSNAEDRIRLSWRKRIRIASDMCSALHFLHHTKPYGIVHGDLKPANILLDSTYTCKLSDFGTCRRLKLTDTTRTPRHKTQEPSYTMFYCDPEYLESNTITTHSDVFAFGVVLLQLVTGRNAMAIRKLVQDALDNGKLNEIVDASAKWPLEVAGKLAQLGLRCIERSRKDRPDLATKVWTEIKSLEQVASPS